METHSLLPALQEISLCKLARESYYYQLNEVLRYLPPDIEPLTNTFDLIEQKLPQCLVLLFRQKIKLVTEELNCWFSNTSKIIYPSYRPYYNLTCHRYIVQFWPYIVWDSDGFIDYEKTAMNLLAYPLDLSQKYMLMCKYCMEEQLKKFWAEDSSQVWEECTRDTRSHVIMYWRSFRRNNSKIIKSDFLLYPILRELDPCEFVAVGYFWNYLQLQSQCINIHYCSNPKVLRSWLEKLDETKLKQVVNNKLRDILIIYTKFLSYPKYVYWFWTLIKDMISEDGFVTLLLFIKRSVDESVKNINLSTTLLIDIWTSSSPKLKSYAFQNARGSCIYNICSVMHRDMNESLERDDRIVSVILSDASREFREIFWQNECVQHLVNYMM